VAFSVTLSCVLLSEICSCRILGTVAESSVVCLSIIFILFAHVKERI